MVADVVVNLAPLKRAKKCMACGAWFKDRLLTSGAIHVCVHCAGELGNAAEVANAMDVAEAKRMPLKVLRGKSEEIWHPANCECAECKRPGERAQA